MGERAQKDAGQKKDLTAMTMPDTTLTSAELDELEREIEDGRVSRLSMHTALASRILAAARAGLEAGKAEEWLPIETAPRDGADIILGSEPQMFNGQPVPARPPMTDTIDVAALVERLRSHEGIGAALAHDRGQTGRFVTAIMDEAATALQSQADALAEARRENEALRGETFLASAEAAEHHRDNAIKMWDEERKLRTTAEASLATMREALGEAERQIVYLHEKLGTETGSGNSALAKIRRALGGSNAE